MRSSICGQKGVVSIYSQAYSCSSEGLYDKEVGCVIVGAG